MKEKENLIKTFSGIKIQIILLISSLVTALIYNYFSIMKIPDDFVVFMLRLFTVFADFGVFLAVGYLIDFKRAVVIGYVYKALIFLSLKSDVKMSQYDFSLKIVGLPFVLVAYYKITLFLIIFTASYIIELDYEDQRVKISEEQEQNRLLSKQSNTDQQSQMNHQPEQSNNYQQASEQKNQIKPDEETPNIKSNKSSASTKTKPQLTQTQKTIQRIRKSLKYHKEDQFYKKIQIFYFIIYHSICLLLLFPIQQYIIDFTRILQVVSLSSLSNLNKQFNIQNLTEKSAQTNIQQFLGSIFNLDALNNQILYYINVTTILNVICYWFIILFGQFKIKSKYPELIKQYILSIPVKCLIIQLLSLLTLFIIIITTPISTQIPLLKEITLSHVINVEIFLVGYLTNTLLTLFISFLLIRIYLGQVFYLNKFVSKKFNFSSNTSQNQYFNLDYFFYDSIIQNDINKVRYFLMNQQELIPRHKLKRYSQEDKLKQYVNKELIIQIQSLFEDFMILDLYNKYSRLITIIMFYISLVVFMVSMNVNDTYIVNQDNFFKHVPACLLLFTLFLISKYQSTANIFYPKIITAIYTKLSIFLAERKVYNVIRLIHFYAIIFSIWFYRIYSEIYLPPHQNVQISIKQTLFNFYSSSSLLKNQIISSLLSGWSSYFLAKAQECDYNSKSLAIDSIMLILMLCQIFFLKQFYIKYNGKWDTILIILRFIAPIYAFYVFVINMQCLEWSRALFCIFVCIGITFMVNNQNQLERGILRNDQGQYEGN